MNERIKAYYKYLVSTNPKFKEFDKENKGLSVEEVAAKYHIDLDSLDQGIIRIKKGDN